MQELALRFTAGQFTYTQVQRVGQWAVYEQQSQHGGHSHFEVIRIGVAPAKTFPNGQTYPEREVYPNSEQWGRNGWTFYTRIEALAFFRAKTTPSTS